LIKTLPGVTVVFRPEQKVRWDFPRVLKLYQEKAEAPVKPIVGLVTLPLGTALPVENCRFIDLSGLANTNPFTAPFGVPNPGKYLFTGLAVGKQVVGGVPFLLLDPARNKDRGLVVLHSPHAPHNLSWPRQVEIPVNQQGKRLFFLGNVHGWQSEDPGTGPWGAVAEYVVHYRDGLKQVVPLITGRTADDWAGPPEAQEVFPGLKGDPWHLNVLGVVLRPVPVQKIVFRDLDTIAAPVLAAVTLEQ
jgi:hypothetical protein